jgi:hypothetical protein
VVSLLLRITCEKTRLTFVNFFFLHSERKSFFFKLFCVLGKTLRNRVRRIHTVVARAGCLHILIHLYSTFKVRHPVVRLKCIASYVTHGSVRGTFLVGGHSIKRNDDEEKLHVILEFYMRMSSSNMCVGVLTLRKVTF